MSAPRPSGPRDPWANEVGAADRFGLFAFLAVIVLFGGVAAGLYTRGSSGGKLVDLDTLLMQDSTAVKLTQSIPGAMGEPPIPLPLKPGVAPVAGGAQVVQPSAQATPAAAKPQPTVGPKTELYVPPVGAAMGIAGARPQAQPTATAVPTAQPTPTAKPGQPAAGQKLKVVNTSGDGVFIRRTPNLNDKIVPWADNTVMEFQGELVEGNGARWAKVKDPRGNVGWIPVQYLAPA